MNFKKLFLRDCSFGKMEIPEYLKPDMPKNVCFYDNDFKSMLLRQDFDNKIYLNARDALVCLAVCNTIIIDEETNEYQSSS